MYNKVGQFLFNVGVGGGLGVVGMSACYLTHEFWELVLKRKRF